MQKNSECDTTLREKKKKTQMSELSRCWLSPCFVIHALCKIQLQEEELIHGKNDH